MRPRPDGVDDELGGEVDKVEGEDRGEEGERRRLGRVPLLISGTGDASARLTLADARLAGTCSLPSGVRSRCESPERTRQPKRSSSTKDTEAAQLAVAGGGIRCPA